MALANVCRHRLEDADFLLSLQTDLDRTENCTTLIFSSLVLTISIPQCGNERRWQTQATSQTSKERDRSTKETFSYSRITHQGHWRTAD
jgi:hypothetical protein